MSDDESITTEDMNELLDRDRSEDFEEIVNLGAFSGETYMINPRVDLSFSKVLFSHTCMMNDSVLFINEFQNASTNNNILKLKYPIIPSLSVSIENSIINTNDRDPLHKRVYIKINISKCHN